MTGSVVQCRAAPLDESPADVRRGARPCDGPSRHFRTACAAAALGLAGTLAAGCRSISLAPDDASWIVTGAEDGASATWTAGDVAVDVPLHAADDLTRVTADVRNSGADPARLTVTTPPGSSAFVPVGTVSGGPPSFDRTWSASLLPGRPVEIPPGVPGRPGTVRIALLPDTRWAGDEAPPVGSRITLDLLVTTRAGSASCPFRFSVVASSGEGWSGMTETARTLVVLLLAAAATAVVLWAG